MSKKQYRVWISRILICAVLFFNLQCALLFLVFPDLYVSAYEIQGNVGAMVVRGFGLLFLMWNVPYFFAAFHPIKFRVSLLQAILMQGIGFVGESWLYFNLGNSHPILSGNILRFIFFDGAGFLALLVAGWFVLSQIRKNSENQVETTKVHDGE